MLTPLTHLESLPLIRSIIKEEAERTNRYLKSLGLPGLSAKHFLTDINLRLEEEALPILKYGQLTAILSDLGYKAQERKWSPQLRALYTAWTRKS